MAKQSIGSFSIVAREDGAIGYSNEWALAEGKTQRTLGEAAVFGGYELLSSVESPSGQLLKSKLESEIINQPEAIKAIVDVVNRAEVRLPSDPRPIATLAFLGPTGVGKTETALVLAEAMTGDRGVLKIDCSSFSHGHEVASLTGSPPGYVSRNQQPVLNSYAVEQARGRVILFDEIEKGSPELYDLMLQIMDKGSLTLNNGETVSFRDTIIIMTSNLGAREMADRLSTTQLGFGSKKSDANKQSLDGAASAAFEKFFRPEFIGRISKRVVFHPLDEQALDRLIDIKLTQANEVFNDSFGLHLSLSDACRGHLIDQALADRHLGARPLIDQLDQKIYSQFGRHVSAETIGEGCDVMVFHEDELPESCRHLATDSLVFAAKPSTFRRKRIRKYHPKPTSPINAPVVFLEPTDDYTYDI